VEEISSFDTFPPEEQWRYWSEQLHGVDKLMIVMNGAGYGNVRPIHANLAFTNARCDIDAFYPSNGKLSKTCSPIKTTCPFDKEKAMGIWQLAREARRES